MDDDLQRLLAEIAAARWRRWSAYRESLPAHRREVFDLLSQSDQFRVACCVPDTRSDDQKDHDEEREGVFR